MSDWKPRRFWKKAQAASEGDGFTVHLDGRPVRTPAKRALALPSMALARAIAAEWDAQAEVVDPASMPLMRAANSALDKVAVQHGEVAQMLADYGDSDLLCYRADGPAELVARQAAAWDPMLDWAADSLGARLAPRTGLIHAPQDSQALAALAARVHAMTAFELAAFHDLVSLTGSLVLGFSAFHEAHPIERTWEISRLDESWQEEQWGPDDEARAVAALKKDAFVQAHRFLVLLRTDA